MLHRSTSSRRRRASRSVTSSPQGNPPSASLGARGRRASVAAERPTGAASLSNSANSPKERSPRGSVVPEIALDDDDDDDDNDDGGTAAEVGTCRTAEGTPASFGRRWPTRRCEIQLLWFSTAAAGSGSGCHGSDAPSARPARPARSSRGAGTLGSPKELDGRGVSRAGRRVARRRDRPRPSGSLGRVRAFARAPVVADGHVLCKGCLQRVSQRMMPPDVEAAEASPRGGLQQPEQNRSPRNSLVPEDYCRSQRGSLVHHDPDRGSPRNSLTPEMGRSPRNSLVPDAAARSPRHSLVPDNAVFAFDRSPRNSLAPEPVDRSIVPESIGWNARGSVAPEPSRSPRGSICPESNRGPHEPNKSPRGSAAGEIEGSARGGDAGGRSPRGSVGGSRDAATDASPRGSLGGAQDRRRSTKGSLSFHEPRRASADQGSSRNRSGSPYRQRDRDANAAAGARHTGNYGAQVNLGYGTNAWADSRRASSSVSQFSGDESRRLCGGIANLAEKGVVDVAGTLTVATYGSLAFQLKDAHLEASGTLDFVARALGVVGKTPVVTVCLACLSAMPLLMLIMGLQFIRDCPREPRIPIYMVVGGTLGGFRMLWTLYAQIRSRRLEVLSVPETRPPHMSPTRLASLALSAFLAGWFVLGNYWILRIKWPDYAPTLFEPNRWCHKNLYVFSLVHLCVVYGTLAVGLLTAVALACCRILACPWPDRYK